jgi:hypothetical protein
MVATYLKSRAAGNDVHAHHARQQVADSRDSRVAVVEDPTPCNGYVLSQDDITIIERASLDEIEVVLPGARAMWQVQIDG